MTRGKNVFDFVLDAAPQFGGSDPYNKLIDSDNISSTDGEFRSQFQFSAPDEAL